MFNRRLLIAGLAAMPFARKAEASEPRVHAPGGLAIAGHDPVAYFREGRPVKGRAEHAIEWNGATWRFASAANRAAFANDPDAYAPQFGGYCSYAVSRGYTASTDPEAWTVQGGKLYLNYSRNVRAIWSRDMAGNIARGNANWPGVLSH